jgi:plastocyanin
MANGIREDAPGRSSAKTRRQFMQAVATASGGALLLRASSQSFAIKVLAQDEDNSGSGSNNGRGRGRGRGGREDDEPEIEEPDEEVAAAQVVEAPPGSLEIRIVSDDAGGFVPAELSVDQGQSVSFVNAHDDEHTATGSGFDTGIIQPGTVVTVTLDTPGRFAYACQIHPEMTGTISVRDASGSVPEAAAAAAPADATTVTIANLAFDPAQISVQSGGAVVWTNNDSVPHTVTAADGTFDSGIFDPGARFSWTFDLAGSFAYACQLHPQMQGTVTVGGEASAAADETTAQPAGETDQTANPPAGIWLLDFTPAASTIFGAQTALLTFHEDGTIAADFAASTASSEQSTALGDGHGEWEQQDEGVMIILAALVEDADDQYLGLLTLQAEASLDESATAIDGEFTFEMASSAGDSIGDGTGTLSGRKIEFAV